MMMNQRDHCKTNEWITFVEYVESRKCEESIHRPRDIQEGNSVIHE